MLKRAIEAADAALIDIGLMVAAIWVATSGISPQTPVLLFMLGFISYALVVLASSRDETSV